ncbi:hypothetical protein SteCoe_8566 [Stentor coeruleus]|uniref:Uncharacterized protein n=1 Tax=Stentor coeruleus TaxID=5963 RepID=A0A1R2CJV0_9CILI|nr:hypothetical protein SteCoe_8566 [Stentor coeruleus]
MSKQNINTDFIKSLEREIKRLSPNLSISLRTIDPLAQILEIVRIAVDTLIEEKKSLESEYTKLSRESSPKMGSEDSKELSISKSKIFTAQKELLKLEELLKAKEKHLNLRDQDNVILSSKFEDERRALDSEKSQLKSKTRELEIRIRALQEKEADFTSLTENFWHEKSAFEREKQSFILIKQKIEENRLESEKIKEKTLITQENLQKEREKFDFEWRMLEEKTVAMTLKQDYIDKSQLDLERKKKMIEEERTKVIIEKENLIKIKQEISDERLSRFEERQENDKSKRLNISKINESAETHELSKMFEILKSQIEVYNKEVASKESKIETQQQGIKKNHEKISNGFSSLGFIHQSLQRTKSEILQFNNYILPQIEDAFKEANNLIQIFAKRFTEVEAMEKKLSDYLKTMSKENGNSKERKPQIIIEKSHASSESPSPDMMENMTKELEGRLKAVEIRERQLNAGISENTRTAEYLKDVRNKLNKAKVDINEERNKIKIQVFQLEQGIKTLTAKENEVHEYKKELDKRANLLKIKEKQLDLQLIKFRESNNYPLSDPKQE